MTAPRLRPATPADAPHLARLIDLAGEGLPTCLWSRMMPPGGDVWAFGAARAARDEGAFSRRHAIMAERDGAAAGAAVTYRIADTPEPLDGLPPMARPLQELENLAPGTQYVNVLATYPAHRRAGVGTALLGAALARAGAAGSSIIVADENREALRLYRSLGFAEVARPAIVKDGWSCASRDWLLLLRPQGPLARLAETV